MGIGQNHLTSNKDPEQGAGGKAGHDRRWERYGQRQIGQGQVVVTEPIDSQLHKSTYPIDLLVHIASLRY